MSGPRRFGRLGRGHRVRPGQDVPEDSGRLQVRVRLPAQLRELAGLPAEVLVEVGGPVTQRSVLDALEGRYPVLKGTIRDRATAKRRPFIRFYACEEDYSNAAPDDDLARRGGGGGRAVLHRRGHGRRVAPAPWRLPWGP